MTQPLTRPGLVLWIAGIMMGTGAGLIIGRSLPAAPGQVVAATEHPATSPDREPRGFHSPGSLFDPRQFPGLPGDGRHSESGIDARNTSAPVEPRLLPEGEATPVTKQSSMSDISGGLAPVGNQQVHPGASGARISPEPGSSPGKTQPVQQPSPDPEDQETSAFRRELQELAPEFSLKALDEIERIRQSIETEQSPETPAERQ